MPSQKTVCATLVLCGVLRAAVLRFPLSDAERYSLDHEPRSLTSFSPESQTAFQDDLARGPIGDAALFAYGLNISVGNPPQAIKVLLDVEQSAFFVQSSRCHTSLCLESNDSVFNSSASSTYSAGDRTFELVYANAWVDGDLAEDSVNVNGIHIEGMTILDATSIYPRTFIHWYFDYHGVLGLAPGFANRMPHIPSAWETIVDNKLLERNLFSISPPTGLRYMDRPRTNGELILGNLPPRVQEESAIKLPMKFGPYAWATSLERMTFGNTTVSFSSGTAAFSTVWPFIFIPYWFGRELLRQVGKWEDFGFFRSIPCDNRNLLPEWTFGIGGHNITLNAYQYTFEMTASWLNETFCVLALERSDTNDTIGLGWSFWENFRGVAFDQDEWTISLFE